MRVKWWNKSWTMRTDKHGFGGADRTGPKFTVNEKDHIMYVLEFQRVSDTGQEYVTETQQLAEAQHLVVTQGLQKLFKDTQWTVEQLTFSFDWRP
jgi:hypothetical protein